jgi:hypothetical protein
MITYCLSLSIFLLSSCSAGYVSSRPADVVYARPVSPGHGYVWVTGEWEWRGGSYHWHGGSWQRAREGQAWKSGYWENNQRGYRWHKGRWE